MTILLFLLTLGCVKQDRLLSSAKYAFNDNNCLKTLEAYVRSAGCPEIFLEQRENEILFRCKKPDNERGKFYDNYWFRISPSSLVPHEDVADEIEAHTICLDDNNRLEAYPPN